MLWVVAIVIWLFMVLALTKQWRRQHQPIPQGQTEISGAEFANWKIENVGDGFAKRKGSGSAGLSRGLGIVSAAVPRLLLAVTKRIHNKCIRAVSTTAIIRLS
jgi:hypothetical protein